jgi:hypothetical protein
MLSNRFLGVPLVVWGGVCLAVALVWAVFWPSDRVAVCSGLRFVILRWFHALTWVLLALAAFIGAFSGSRPGTARPIALLALAVYLAFMATFISSTIQ